MTAPRGNLKGMTVTPKRGKLVYICYKDHVLFHRTNSISQAPQKRECVGWLVHESPDYIIVTWDRDAGPPTLKGGDPKASGLVLLRRDILKFRRFADE